MSLDGEIYFDMNQSPHRLYGKSKFMLKRWRKFDIFTKTGSFVRSENPRENTYASTSVYLYDYVVVDDKWFFNNVVVTQFSSCVPSNDWDFAGTDGTSSFWNHFPNTWKNSPNSITNDFILRPNQPASDFIEHQVSGSLPGYIPNPVPFPFNGLTTEQYLKLMSTPIKRDDGTYFEIVRGYPRNHFSHKRSIFSLERFTSYGLDGGVSTTQVYQKGRNIASTTIGLNGISDGTDPVQTTQVSNMDIIKSDNVIYH